VPDEISFRSVANDELIVQPTFPEFTDSHAHQVLEQVTMTNALYTFGTSYPGAITLHNYSRYLQHRTEQDGITFDLATTEILRDRERGVPRYNEFRQLVHRPPVKTFEELSDNPVWVEELRRVYDNNIDLVDLMIGMYAEKRPEGFAFSDTAFRIFIVMASRRLNSDRFFTTDFNPKVYTQVGFQWVLDNTMSSVLTRHFPALKASLHDVKNPFAPWPRAKS
jgi:hypothetical protein